MSKSGKEKIFSKEHRKNISESNKGDKNGMYGKPSAMKNKKHTLKSIEKMSGLNHHGYGKNIPEDVKIKISNSLLGHIRSENSKKKQSVSVSGNKNHQFGKIGVLSANFGNTHSVAAKKKMSDIKLGKKHNIITCPHCQKKGGANGMKRWHFDNCKLKEDYNVCI